MEEIGRKGEREKGSSGKHQNVASTSSNSTVTNNEINVEILQKTQETEGIAKPSVSPAKSNPWDKDNEDEQTLAFRSKRHKSLLYDSRSELLQVVDPAPLWPHLLQLKVIDAEAQQRLQVRVTRYNYFLGCIGS